MIGTLCRPLSKNHVLFDHRKRYVWNQIFVSSDNYILVSSDNYIITGRK